jgi:hypothetical protein
MNKIASAANANPNMSYLVNLGLKGPKEFTD